ncbi:MAG: molecular chaperone DnaK [Bacteroidia bacterium]|nr:MAG: molecular chaperone DnaK [Bacteroidia bacterium]
MEEKTYYTAEELQEFKELILDKLEKARAEYKSLQESLKETAENAADGYNITEYGTDTQEKEQLELFLMRQAKFIDSLERALMRIENGTYGKCKVTGKLIPKERLRAVPHTEISIEAKLAQKKNPQAHTPSEYQEDSEE